MKLTVAGTSGVWTGGAPNASPDLPLRLPAVAVTPTPLVEALVSTAGPSRMTGKTPALGGVAY